MRCTKAVFLGDREALAQMNAKEIERAFKTAPRTNMIMDPGKFEPDEIITLSIFCALNSTQVVLRF